MSRKEMNYDQEDDSQGDVYLGVSCMRSTVQRYTLLALRIYSTMICTAALVPRLKSFRSARRTAEIQSVGETGRVGCDSLDLALDTERFQPWYQGCCERLTLEK